MAKLPADMFGFSVTKKSRKDKEQSLTVYTPRGTASYTIQLPFEDAVQRAIDLAGIQDKPWIGMEGNRIHCVKQDLAIDPVESEDGSSFAPGEAHYFESFSIEAKPSAEQEGHVEITHKRSRQVVSLPIALLDEKTHKRQKAEERKQKKCGALMRYFWAQSDNDTCGNDIRKTNAERVQALAGR